MIKQLINNFLKDSSDCKKCKQRRKFYKKKLRALEVKLGYSEYGDSMLADENRQLKKQIEELKEELQKEKEANEHNTALVVQMQEKEMQKDRPAPIPKPSQGTPLKKRP